MFEAIRSRAKDQQTISADQAYRLVFNQSDWGAIQSRDGWICPQCRQPVFLKPPHERVTKGYSFVVDAHFCHHSTTAAAQCALYHAGGKRSSNLADSITSDRKQSLQRFLSGGSETIDYVSELLSAEERVLRDVARELGIRKVEHFRHTHDFWCESSSTVLDVAAVIARLDRVDSFLAGVFALGIEHKKRVNNGFLAVKGRKNKLRSLIIDFGRNRKRYFHKLIESGLESKHAQMAKQIADSIATLVEIAEHASMLTHYGMPGFIIDSVLDKVGLIYPGEQPPNYLQYLFLLPLLGNELRGFEWIGCTHAQSDPDIPPAADSPVRITAKGKLLVGDSVITRLVKEGAKLDGLTSFVRPLPQSSFNSFILVPGKDCLLLTSAQHADPTESSGYTSICPEIIEADSELPQMLWNLRTPVNSELYTGRDLLVDKETLRALVDAASIAFGVSYTRSRTGLRFRRVHSGIRITLQPT